MPNSLLAISEYLPRHEALLVSIEMGDYLVDYYLHRKQHAAATTADHDERLKDLIACMAIHLTLRSPGETHAWTVHMISEQPYSLFATGSAGAPDATGAARGFIVGHVLTEHIRHTDVNSFHAQFSNNKGGAFKSFVRCETSEIATMVERYYDQSEQLPLRIDLSRTSDTAVALSALPGYDREWFEEVPLESLISMKESKKRMRECRFEFACDCSPEKLLPFFRSLPNETLAELYGTDPVVHITCPRCGRQFPIGRSEIESGDRGGS